MAVSRFLARREEEKGEKERSNSSISREKDDVAEEEVKEENETAECEGEFSQIFEVVRGVTDGETIVGGSAQSGGHSA